MDLRLDSEESARQTPHQARFSRAQVTVQADHPAPFLPSRPHCSPRASVSAGAIRNVRAHAREGVLIPRVLSRRRETRLGRDLADAGLRRVPGNLSLPCVDQRHGPTRFGTVSSSSKSSPSVSAASNGVLSVRLARVRSRAARLTGTALASSSAPTPLAFRISGANPPPIRR